MLVFMTFRELLIVNLIMIKRRIVMRGRRRGRRRRCIRKREKDESKV